MHIIVLLNALKVGSFRTRQMLKVDLSANGAGAYTPYAPPLPTGLCMCGRTGGHGGQKSPQNAGWEGGLCPPNFRVGRYIGA